MLDLKARQKETVDIAMGMVKQLVPTIDEARMHAILDFVWTGGSATGRMSTMEIIEGSDGNGKSEDGT